MMNWKNREELVPNVLLIAAILVLLASLGVMLFVPPPSVAGLVTGRDRSRRQLENEIAQAKQRTQELHDAVVPQLWTGSPDSVTASILAKLTNAANQRKLKIGAFRPQKPQAFPGLTELPFSVQVSGDYPTVRNIIALLDYPAAKLALRSVQVALANANDSSVTATLSLSAYMETRPEPNAAKGGATAPTKQDLSSATTGGGSRG